MSDKTHLCKGPGFQREALRMVECQSCGGRVCMHDNPWPGSWHVGEDCGDLTLPAGTYNWDPVFGFKKPTFIYGAYPVKGDPVYDLSLNKKIDEVKPGVWTLVRKNKSS